MTWTCQSFQRVFQNRRHIFYPIERDRKATTCQEHCSLLHQGDNCPAPRLSVRKKYNATEMDHHNRNYEKKFSKELKELNVKRQTEHTQPTTRKLVKLSEADIESQPPPESCCFLKPLPPIIRRYTRPYRCAPNHTQHRPIRQVISVCKNTWQKPFPSCPPPLRTLWDQCRHPFA